MEPIDFPLKNKIILITGRASGIGLSLTHQSLALGARVLVSDLHSSPALDTLLASHPNLVFVPSDVTRWTDFSRVFAACEERWNDVPDAYGICAGLFEPSFSNFWGDPEEAGGYRMVDVNVGHPVKLTRLAIRGCLGRGKGKRGSVCIVSSIAGISGNIAAPLYCATKHAIVGFVKSMTPSESFTGVKVTTICPGLVNTPLIDQQKVEQYSVKQEASLSPDEVAACMLRVIQEKRYGCGTVLELSKAGERVIPEWNVEPPRGTGTGMKEEEVKAGAKALLEPVLRSLEVERGGAKL